jgi:lipopolysaccharide biosynthesis regulator YciM
VARAGRTTAAEPKADLLLRAATLWSDKLGRPDRALPLLEKAAATSPENVEAALMYARVQATLGRPKAGLDVLERIAEHAKSKRTPLLADVYLELAKAHLADDELLEALDRLKAGFAISMRRPELALLLGLVALDLGEDNTAERALMAVTMLAVGRTADEHTADRRTAYTHLAKIAEAKGDSVKARAWAARAATEGRYTTLC